MARASVSTVVLLVATLAALAGASGAQTQPEVTVEPVRLDEPVPPEQGVRVDVNATVSCEGWGETGDETVAVHIFEGPGPEHRTEVHPAEIELPAGPNECQRGDELDASTTLTIEPTREARAGSGIATQLDLRLEERTDGEVVREHGPWSAPVAYVTGLWAEIELRPADQRVDLGWGERGRAGLVAGLQANGIAATEIQVRSPDGLSVAVDDPERRIDPDDPPGSRCGSRTPARRPLASASRT